MKVAAGVDIGGTNIVCGLVDSDGNVLIKRKYPTLPEKGWRSVLEGIRSAIDGLGEEAGIANEDIAAIGLGVPGLLDPEEGRSIQAVNLGWENVPVASELKRLTNKPVYIDNDVRMYVYGEAVAGAGRNYHYVFGITIGTGLAAAFVQSGELYRGHRYMAGEIGHVPVDGVDFRCKCGQTGCLETVVSASGIARLARVRLERGESSILREWFPDPAKLRASDVSRACGEGDPLAREVLEETGRTLGRALSWVVPTLSPDVIVIGGGGALAGDALFGPMKQELDGRLLQAYVNQFDIRTAELNDDAGVIGSALWAMHKSSAIEK